MGEIVDQVIFKASKGQQDTGNAIQRELVLQKIREKFRIFQENAMKELDQKLDKMLEELLNDVNYASGMDNGEVRPLVHKENGIVEKSSKKLDNNKTAKKKLPEKQFTPSNSLLTELLEIQHIRTIYHIFIVILLILFLHTLVHDYLVDGSFNIGLFCIKEGFAKFPTALAIWGCLQLSTFVLYYAFKMWAVTRNTLNSNSLRTVWNVVCLISFILYQIGFIVFAIKQAHQTNIGDACAMAVLMETVRFLMKSHAFVRSNAPRVIAGKVKDETGSSTINLSSFGTYVYFLFAPTLVYRDHYPRTQTIRWSHVARNYAEVVGTIFYISFIFERFLIPSFKDFGKVPMEAKTLIVGIFGCIIPATTAMITSFFCLLHSWMNASAEILRFADRTFYKDWWNAPSFSVYYRTWNIVVHDWLYTYIYKDMYEHVYKESKVTAALITFFVSALFHEVILTTTFRFFYPVLFVIFLGFGSTLSFINVKHYKNLGNVLFWLTFATGNGVVVSLYCIEYAAHLNCQFTNSSFLDYLIPVSWRCY